MLKRKRFIDADAYRILNDYLAGVSNCGLIDPGSEDMEIEDEEDNINSKISETVRYIIQHDRNEMEDLLQVFEKETVDTNWIEDVLSLRKMTETWIEDEIAGKEEDLVGIKRLLDSLRRSAILQSQLIRFEAILNDIRNNRVRVAAVLERMANVLNEENADGQRRALDHLFIAGIINADQRDALMENVSANNLTMESLLTQLKQVKIGRGLSFLPRVTNGLLSKMKDLLAEYAGEKTDQLRTKLLAILDELLQRKAISKKEHVDKITANELD